MEEFKIRKSIRTSDEGVNDYIESLEDFILNLKASNTNRLIFKLDELNGVIADDIQKIIDDEAFSDIEVNNDGAIELVTKSNLSILTDSKDSKLFERIISLYGKLKDLKETASVVKSMIPEVEEQKQNTENLEVDKSLNIFEQLQEKHYQKKKK